MSMVGDNPAHGPHWINPLSVDKGFSTEPKAAGRGATKEACGAPPWLLLLCTSTPLAKDSFCRETFHCETKLILSEREQGSQGLSELRRMSPLCCGSSSCLLFAWKSSRVPHCCSGPQGLGLCCVFGWLLLSIMPIPRVFGIAALCKAHLTCIWDCCSLHSPSHMPVTRCRERTPGGQLISEGGQKSAAQTYGILFLLSGFFLSALSHVAGWAPFILQLWCWMLMTVWHSF